MDVSTVECSQVIRQSRDRIETKRFQIFSSVFLFNEKMYVRYSLHTPSTQVKVNAAQKKGMSVSPHTHIKKYKRNKNEGDLFTFSDQITIRKCVHVLINVSKKINFYEYSIRMWCFFCVFSFLLEEPFISVIDQYVYVFSMALLRK